MTYRELLEQLNRMSEEQLDMTVIFWDTVEDEYYQADIVAADDETSHEHLGASEGVPHPVIVHTSHIEGE
jgi:hypothetical protein